ncbi:MAG: TIR domain-containing protein [Alphaproteobacteria bacterium]|nr:TIR domain-containing protein [Alphaproteobacteria bacterium]
MADVFISYSKARSKEAADLARELVDLGFDVWWDSSLVPTGTFGEEIDRQLDAARAVIVIWSEESAKSKWVRSEAGHADRQEKLVNSRCAGLDPFQIPKPFDQIHSVLLDDIRAIVRALDALKVPRSGGLQAVIPAAEDTLGVADADDRLFQEVESSGTAAAYEYYLAELPEGRHALIARFRLRELSQEAKSAGDDGQPASRPQGKPASRERRASGLDAFPARPQSPRHQPQKSQKPRQQSSKPPKRKPKPQQPAQSAPQPSAGWVASGIVNQIYQVPGVGVIAGVRITDGAASQGSEVSIRRGRRAIANTRVISLEINRVPVTTASTGDNCGILFDNCTNFRVGDLLEFAQRSGSSQPGRGRQKGLVESGLGLVRQLFSDPGEPGYEGGGARSSASGVATVITVFDVPGVGKVAGCQYVSGLLEEGDEVTLVSPRKNRRRRDTIASLKIYDTFVPAIAIDTEFGLRLEHRNDYQVGDRIEVK